MSKQLAEALDRIRTLEAKVGMGHNGGPSLETDARELIPEAEAAYLLGCSTRTLARRDQQPELAFPKPVLVNGRRFRRPGELAKWVAKHAKASAERKPKPRSFDPRSKPPKPAIEKKTERKLPVGKAKQNRLVSR